MKKFSPMRFTAATEEAAVAGALQLVGAHPENADYEVLETNAKGVTVRIKPKIAFTSASAPADTEAPSVKASHNTPEESVSRGSQPPFLQDDDYFLKARNETAMELGDEGFIDSEIEAETELLESQSRGENDYDDAPEANETDEAGALAMEGESQDLAISAPTQTIERARQLAQDILGRMNLSAQVGVVGSPNPHSIELIVEGEDIGILIGKQGATLQSFQYIVNLTMNNGAYVQEGIRVSIDAGNYRARRQSSLEQTARMAAQRARASGRPVRLEPMPAGERRIIHMYLQTERGVTTQSEGREPGRRLVITPDESANSGNGLSRYEGRGRATGGFGRAEQRLGSGRGRGFRR